MKSTVSIIGILILCLPVFTQAQAHPKVVQTFGDVRKSTCLALDGDALWIGTLGGGMIRYEKENHHRFDSLSGLPGNRVQDCLFHKGTLWVATDSGLARFHSSTHRFVEVISGRFLRLADSFDYVAASMAHNVIYQIYDNNMIKTQLDFTPIAIASDSEGKWVAGGMDGRLYISEDKRYLSIPRLKRVGSNLNISEPIVAIGYLGRTLYIQTATRSFRWSRRQFTQIERPPQSFLMGWLLSDKKLQGFSIRAASHWNENTIIATERGVLRRKGRDHWEELPIVQMPCGDRISALAEFNGSLWIGSFDAGLCRWDGSTFHHYDGPDYLPSDMINDLSADANYLYVATNKGLTLIDNRGQVVQKTKQDCLRNLAANCPWFSSVNGVTVDEQKGAVWISDLGSVHRIDTDPWHHYFRRAGIQSHSITRIAARDDRVAVGTSDQGIRLKRGKKFYRIDEQDGVTDNWITDLSWDSKGRLLVATCTKGISRLNLDNSIETWTSSNGLLDDYTLTVREIFGAIWVGTLSGLSIIKDEEVVNLTTLQGLSGNEIHDIISYRDRIWVATNGGLSVIKSIN